MRGFDFGQNVGFQTGVQVRPLDVGTPLTSSATYYDMAGDGKQHRTAWAGAGNGVLVLGSAGRRQDRPTPRRRLPARSRREARRGSGEGEVMRDVLDLPIHALARILSSHRRLRRPRQHGRPE